MKVSLGADHAGVELKDQLKAWLTSRGVIVNDVGTHSADSVDYPDFAAAVANDVVSGAADRGVLVCGTGLGMAIAANKFPGIRAVPVVDEASARLGREHNDANVLTLGARLTAPEEAKELLRIFLETKYEGGRHQRRLDKITALEHS
ncbi:MAG: ribose 5-phosphate isomerase B [Acidobacteria bacterium]|nr:MAG: ribose 5-phosphate isomerase B [Acidobacteriota bacterium]